MKTRYNSVIDYQITATCLAPFRCGNGENDMEKVLRDHSGTFFLGGTSLAGAFRAYGEKKEFQTAQTLFGSTEEESQLIFSDGIFSEKTKMVLRPRLAINHSTGMGKEGGKFDMAHLEKGSVFTFTLTWLGEEEERVKASHFLKDCISALHHGEISLGGQKNNGFGRVSLEVHEKHFRLSREKERQEWLSGTWTTRPLTLTPPEKVEGISLRITGEMKNLLVKQGGKDKVIQQMREGGTPIIPASSFRGVLRHRVQSIASFMALEDDFVSLLFGSSENIGALSFRDVYLTEGRSNQITRIHINKFTGGVISQALFTEENFSSPVAWEIKISPDVPQRDKAICLLLYALRDMALGLVTLGSGVSIGRGVVDISSVSVLQGKKTLGKFTVTENKEINLSELTPFLDSLEGVS